MDELREMALAWIAERRRRSPSSPGTARTTGCPAARRPARRSRRPGGGAGDAQRQDARAVSGGAGDSRGDGRRRAGRLRHRHAHREPQARQDHDRADREEHDHRVLLQPERDPAGSSRPQRLSPWKPQGRHPRRRHDGCRHRARERVARHPRCGREGNAAARRQREARRRRRARPPRRGAEGAPRDHADRDART